MDYSLVQTAEKDLIYYGVYNTEVETQDGSDVLCTVRKTYFETGHHQKNRISFNAGGEVYKTSYSIEDGKPLKWKKLVGSKMTERSVVSNEGYYIETLDQERRPFKRSYFDLHHRWLSSEYYSLSDRKNPIWTLIPSTDGEKPVILRKSGRGETDVLYPFEHVLDKELTEKLNILTFEPQIYCRTSSGSFYFCTASQSRTRAAAMKKLLEREAPSAEEEEEEKIEPAFIVSTQTDEKAKSVRNADIDDIIEEESTKVRPAEKKAGSDENRSSEKTEEKATDNNAAVAVPEISVNKEAEKLPAAVQTNDEETDTAEIQSIIPTGDIKVETPRQSGGELCSAGGDCPFERENKLIIESGGSVYYYFGGTENDKRNGFGRTIMPDGKTAYEGGYLDDKRDGFGVYYYRSGRLCYAGVWKQNRREGLGAAFSSSDGSVFVGRWNNNQSIGAGASFSGEGKLVYAGKANGGKRDGAGITPASDGWFVGKYRNGEYLGTGTLFDEDGNLLYCGGYDSGKRTGDGIEYNPDGTILYKGQWKNDRRHGEGILYLKEGGTLSGQFRAGKANGNCTLTDKNGRIIYTGSYMNDTYNGTGRIWREDGGYAEGRFVDGEPTGIFNEYDSQKHLLYCGEWNDMHRNGKGVAYENGEKLYEGSFVSSQYHGEGKLYENGQLVYAGTFDKGRKHGFGIEFCGDDIVYQGMWENNRKCGCGILYDDGLPRYAGCFKDDMREGRINEISGRNIIRRSIYENDKLVYMCEYDENGGLKYYGSVSGGQRSGMGCLFGDSCEKEFEGIFKAGKPEKPMHVFVRELAELPQCKQLHNTEYELFRSAPEYIIEKQIGPGIYTGRIKGGIPNGCGTMLYFDHRYTGEFSDGKATGKGIIYTRDGSEISGIFSLSPTPDCRTAAFADVTYYIAGSISSD